MAFILINEDESDLAELLAFNLEKDSQMDVAGELIKTIRRFGYKMEVE
jgi:hypothetical protein